MIHNNKNNGLTNNNNIKKNNSIIKTQQNENNKMVNELERTENTAMPKKRGKVRHFINASS